MTIRQRIEHTSTRAMAALCGVMNAWPSRTTMTGILTRTVALWLLGAGVTGATATETNEQLFVSNLTKPVNFYAALRRSTYVSTRFIPGRALSVRVRTVTLRLARGAGCTAPADPLALPIEVSILSSNLSGEHHATLDRADTAQALTGSYAEHRFTVPQVPPLPVGAGGISILLVRAAAGSPNDCVRVGLTASTEEDPTSTVRWEIGDTFGRLTTPGYFPHSSQESAGAILMSVSGDPISDDVSLSALSVTESSGTMHTLDPGAQNPSPYGPGFLYGLTLDPSTHTITVRATTTDPDTEVEYVDGRDQAVRDADPTTPGLQLRVRPGRTILALRAEAASRHFGYSTIVVRRPEVRACAATDLSGRHQLWASTIRPGTRTTGRTASAHGFESGRSGHASAETFELNGTPYRITNIVNLAGGSGNGGLIVTTTPTLPAQAAQGLSIHVCGRTFALSDARLLRGVHHYWQSAGLDWTRPLERHVALSRIATPDDADRDRAQYPIRMRVSTGWTAFSCSNASCAYRDSKERTLVVTLDEGVRYRVEMRGAADKHADLQDAQGTSIASAYGPAEQPAIMEHTASSDGDVFIRITGPARIRVVEASTPASLDEVVGSYRSDCPDREGEASCVVLVSDPKTASIGTAGDVDYFSIRLTEHRHHLISVAPYALAGASTGLLNTPEITLFTNDGNGLWREHANATADAEGIARITYVRTDSTSSGRLSLRVDGANGATGTYVVSVREMPGPVVSVSDATAREGVDAAVRFTIDVAPSAGHDIAVEYRTVDGTARAGADYAASSGTVTIAAGASSAAIEVPVIDDQHDEGSEAFTIELLDATGAVLGRSTATGTIVNTDPVPRKWLARVGQGTARQIAEAVADRMRPGRAMPRVVVAGHAMNPSAHTERPAEHAPTHAGPTLGLDETLAGASFQVSRSTTPGAAAPWALWGTLAQTSGSSGRNEELDASIRNTLVGGDVAFDDRVLGVALAHTDAHGGYGAGGPDALEASFTGVYPYAGLRTQGGGAIWASAGGGSGEFRIESDEGVRARSDLSYWMVNAGLRQPLGQANPDTPQLSLVSDWAWSRTATPGAPGAFARTTAHSNWARAGIRAEHRYELDGGGHLAPRIGIGIRHDFGDAETGTSLDADGALRYVSGRFSGQIGARALISDTEDSYREWGLDASLAFDATRERSDRGLYVSLTPGISNQAFTTGAHDQWEHGASDTEAAATADLDARYGLAPGMLGRSVSVYSMVRFEPGTATPTLGLRWALGTDGELTLESTETEGDRTLRAGLQARF